MATPFKSGFVAIIGPPNVGKSTLLNTLVGEKVSVVTPKPQTTRNRILGIKNLPEGQLIFLDTPGIHAARKKFNLRLVEIAQAVFRESDLVLLIAEAIGPIPEEAFRYAIKGLQGIQKPIFLLINKIDLIDKRSLLPLLEKYRTLFSFQEIVPVSARTGSGVGELEKILLHYLPEGPRLFPEDMYTDQPERFLAAEVIREKAFMLLERELPYSVAVEIQEFTERTNEVLFIRASIWVEKLSQKGILIGKKGSMLREIGRRSRKELEMMLHTKVYLDLWVTVKKGWTQNDAAIRHSLTL